MTQAAPPSADILLPAPRASRSGADGVLALAAAAVYAAAIAFGATIPVLLALHAAIVVLLALRIVWLARRSREIAAAVVSLAATGAIGPLGAIGAALNALLPASPPSRDVLTAWYDRLSHSTQVEPELVLAAKIAMKRTLDVAAPVTDSYLDVMNGGRHARQQVALGIIARSFDPDYLPTLRIALRSTEPVIRVQAAAVAAKIRPLITTLIRAEHANGAGDGEPLEATAERMRKLRLCLASGLVDEGDRVATARLIERMEARIGDGGMSRLMRIAGGEEAGVLRRAIEERLVRERRFGEMRRLRTLARLPHDRSFRVRPLKRQPDTRIAAE